ncbi:purine-binding chemotaxis protein CheW [Desulfonatronum thiosulfatophilum]|uniref:Purine-binding chemotaxis protein CheW n=1 Tax=Desulfonatronum thiosulfatophilum TaxID=617002 RepID=A0A1G6DF95_9BACT|nr:chemotaxis protein CheW [Desulfonatronum thiosulfatophilum]SDB43525.1 purine-binding chemotaxis protein CheW [Desulfonatronum thiosulfatophilum]
MKTLEQYFNDQPLLSEANSDGATDSMEPTAAEVAFLNKYLGINDPARDHGPAIKAAHPEQVMAGPAAVAPSPSPEPTIPDAVKTATVAPPIQNLREQPILQLIGFRLADQDYALPIDVVQEVIRAVEATKLPSAPPFLSGVVNLRGRVTPLISLRTLLRLPEGKDMFVIVCRHGGLQVGLQIQAVSTMHRIAQDRIDWGVESLLGVQNDMIAGLIRAENKRLISILSLDHLVQSLLKP